MHGDDLLQGYREPIVRNCSTDEIRVVQCIGHTDGMAQPKLCTRYQSGQVSIHIKMRKISGECAGFDVW